MQEAYIQKVLPDPSLREYIWQYTFVDLPFEKASQMEFIVMPSSHTRMILFLGEPSLCQEKPVDRYSLTGFVSRPHVFVPNSRLQQVMVHFTAWGIQPFMDFPLAEITDFRADLNHVFNYDLEDLCTALGQIASTSKKADLLNTFFKNHLRVVRQTDGRGKPLTQYILQTRGTVRLEDICKNLFIGERTAQRLVHNAVGVNFKFFARLVRLEHVRRLMSRQHASLTDIAMQAGYFDQAHFIHDFREAFGESPQVFLKRQQQMIWSKIVANEDHL